MVGFLVAFSLMCFSTRDEIVTVVVSITWLTLFSLLLWWISVLYEGHGGSCLKFGPFKESIKEWITVRKPRANMHSSDNVTELTSSRQEFKSGGYHS